MRKGWLSQLENNFKMRSKKMKQIHVKSKDDQNKNSSNSAEDSAGTTIQCQQGEEQREGQRDEDEREASKEVVSIIGTEVESLHDENQSLSGGSSSSVSVMTRMIEKEQKRSEYLLNHFQRCDVTECGPGAPSGHIPRQLNKPMPESHNIDHNSASLPFLFSQSPNSFLAFPKKALEEVAWDSSPVNSHGSPSVASKRAGPSASASSAANSSRRDSGSGSGRGGSEVSLREVIKSYVVVSQEIPTLPSIQRGESGQEEGGNEVLEASLTPSDLHLNTMPIPAKVSAMSDLKALWVQHSQALSAVSADIHLTDLRELSHLPSSPHVSLIFEYLYCLILGKPSLPPSSPPLQLVSCSPHQSRHKSSSSPRQSKTSMIKAKQTGASAGSGAGAGVGTMDDKDVRKILLKESASLLSLLQHIDLGAIPLQNLSLASTLYKKQITPLSGETVVRLSRPFTKLVK
jgi:hypothetical protein